MEKEQKFALQHRLLQRICDAFSEGDFPSRIDVFKVQDQEIEIARVLHKDPDNNDTDEIAEFYFLETPMSAENVLYFTGIITLATDIPFERFYDVMRAATIMNANMPFGAYTFNSDAAILAFRVDGLLNVEHGEDVAFDQASTIASHTIEMSDRFSPIMVDVCDGVCTPEELRHTLNI